MNLKTCPFCGGAAESDSRRQYRALDTGDIGDAVAVYCIGSCGADISVRLADVPGLSREDALAVVVEHWNRRTDRGGESL